MNEQQLWDMFYVGIVGWQLHPRNLEKDTRDIVKMLNDSADIVDYMIKVRNERCPG